MPTPAPQSTAQPDFASFMRAYQDMVFSTATRLAGNDTQGEDIAQEVFLKAYEHFDQLRSSPTAGGWLKTVTMRLTLNHITRYRKRWRFFSEMRENDTEGEEPELQFAAPDDLVAQLSLSEQQSLVERALAALPDHQRVPLALFHFEEMSYQDIAAQLGVSLAKVKTDILRARAALAKALAQRDIGPQAVGMHA